MKKSCEDDYVCRVILYASYYWLCNWILTPSSHIIQQIHIKLSQFRNSPVCLWTCFYFHNTNAVHSHRELKLMRLWCVDDYEQSCKILRVACFSSFIKRKGFVISLCKPQFVCKINKLLSCQAKLIPVYEFNPKLFHQMKITRKWELLSERPASSDWWSHNNFSVQLKWF